MVRAMSDKRVGIGQNNGIVNVYAGKQGGPSRASIIALVIKSFAEGSSDDGEVSRVETDYEVEEKIEYNNLQEYAYLIDEYYEQYALITERSFSVAESERPGSTEKIFRQVHQFYKRTLYSRGGRSPESRMDIVRDYADEIIEDVIDKVKKMVVSSPELSAYMEEDVEFGAGCIVGYAIIECQVLEKPSNVFSCDEVSRGL